MRLSFCFLLIAGGMTLTAQDRPTPFNPDSALAELKVLAGDIGSRPMGSPGERKAMEHAVERFRAFGLDEARIMPFTETPVNFAGIVKQSRSGTAVGVLKGATGRIVVIGAHIDSADPEVPGANDDGSGSAVVLELARVMAKREWNSTIVFCLFGGEESGLVGSRVFVRDFPLMDSVALMLQVDMATGADRLVPFIDKGTTQTPSWLLTAAYEELESLGHRGLSYPLHFFTWNIASGSGASSDHEPFLLKGIPAIDFTTDVSEPIHTPQDNLELFRTGGLERSGDLVYRLAERFDSGVPSERTGSYLTTQWGTWLLLIPTWALWVLNVLSIVVAVGSYVFFRRARTELRGSSRPKVPGLKSAGAFFLVWFAVWGTENVVGLLTGWRSPWYANPEWAMMTAILCGAAAAALIGIWARRWDLSRDPVRFAIRSVGWHIIFVAGTAFLSPRLASYFAAGLLLSSLAWHARPMWLKILLMIMATYPVARLLTPEAYPFIARAFAGIPADGFLSELTITVGFTIFSLLLTLPMSFAWLAVIRDPEARWPVAISYRSPVVIATLVILAFGAVVVSTQQPAYTDFRPRPVHVTYTVDAGADSADVLITSPESLRELRIVNARGDTLDSTKGSRMPLGRAATDAGGWLRVSDGGWQSTDTNAASALVSIEAPFRPYTLSVTYSTRRAEILSASSGLATVNQTKQTATIEYYSFPDVPLTLPLTLRLASPDTVTETVKATFVEPAAAVGMTGGPINIQRRTIVRSSRNISIPPSLPIP